MGSMGTSNSNSQIQHCETVASFPGLPRFFCSLVSVDNIIHGSGRAAFRIRVLLSTETEEQKKRGRPGNEASETVRKKIVDVCLVYR